MDERTGSRQSRRTTTWRILTNDYFSLLMLIGAVVPWILVAVAAFGMLRTNQKRSIPPEAAYFAAAAAAVLTITLIPLSCLRVAAIKRVIQSGTACPGRIIDISFHKDRGRVDYAYNFAGQEYQAGNGIWKNSNTQSLQKGDKVDLLLDPNKPATAYLAALYVEPNLG